MIRFLKTILLIDILRGLWVTFKYTVRPKVTIRYPEQVKTPGSQFRGLLRLYRNELGEPLCIGCKMCQRVCPESCFLIESARDAKGKMQPTRYDWKLMRCSFCGLCVEICPTQAVRFSKEFRMASEDKGKFLFTLDTMYENYDTQKHFQGEKTQP